MSQTPLDQLNRSSQLRPYELSDGQEQSIASTNGQPLSQPAKTGSKDLKSRIGAFLKGAAATVAGAGAAAALGAAVAGILIAAKVITGAILLAFLATPVGWAVAGGVLLLGALIGGITWAVHRHRQANAEQQETGQKTQDKPGISAVGDISIVMQQTNQSKDSSQPTENQTESQQVVNPDESGGGDK